MNDTDVKQRIESRRWAEACYEAAEDKPAFVQRVMQLGGMEPKPLVALVPMTDQEALIFEREVLFFGVHKGEQLADVPLSYLCSLTDPSSKVTDFMDQVRRYLKSPTVKALIEREES